MLTWICIIIVLIFLIRILIGALIDFGILVALSVLMCMIVIIFAIL